MICQKRAWVRWRTISGKINALNVRQRPEKLENRFKEMKETQPIQMLPALFLKQVTLN